MPKALVILLLLAGCEESFITSTADWEVIPAPADAPPGTRCWAWASASGATATHGRVGGPVCLFPDN